MSVDVCENKSSYCFITAPWLKTCFYSVISNDKNLCSKALLSGVKALCKTDLEEEVGRSRHGLQITGDIQASVPPRNNPQVLSPTLSTRCPPVQPHGQKKADFYVGVLHKGELEVNVLLHHHAVVNGTYYLCTRNPPATHALPVFLPSLPILTVHKKCTELVLQMSFTRMCSVSTAWNHSNI